MAPSLAEVHEHPHEFRDVAGNVYQNPPGGPAGGQGPVVQGKNLGIVDPADPGLTLPVTMEQPRPTAGPGALSATVAGRGKDGKQCSVQ
eukprot:3026527-Rhodomonas_salina.1